MRNGLAEPGVRLPNTIHFGDLIWTLVRTDFKVRYHGTVGGFLWAVLKPLAMFVVLVSVFSLVFSNAKQYGLNLVVGLFLWDYFAEGTKVGLLSLHAKGYLLTRARLPLWLLVATSCSNALVTLSVFASALLVYLSLFVRVPTATEAGLFVVYLIQLTLIVFGFSLTASVLFLRFRDLNQVWEVALQAGFFVAPIVYPLDILPEWVHFYLYLWPPTAIIQFSRSVLVNGTLPTVRGHAYLLLLTTLTLLAGLHLHRWLARRVLENL